MPKSMCLMYLTKKVFHFCDYKLPSALATRYVRFFFCFDFLKKYIPEKNHHKRADTQIMHVQIQIPTRALTYTYTCTN